MARTEGPSEDRLGGRRADRTEGPMAGHSEALMEGRLEWPMIRAQSA